MRYPTKTGTKEFCDTIAASIARYEKYRYWASKNATFSKTASDFREAPDTFNFLRHVMRAMWSVRPKCSHRCVSLNETPLKPVQILKSAQPFTQPSKPLWERNGLNIAIKLFRSISYDLLHGNGENACQNWNELVGDGFIGRWRDSERGEGQGGG